MLTMRVGDAGTVITLRVFDAAGVVDLTGSASLSMIFERIGAPSSLEKTATSPAPTEGRVCYTTDGTEFPRGTWRARARVSLPGGSWTSAAVEFRVE